MLMTRRQRSGPTGAAGVILVRFNADLKIFAFDGQVVGDGFGALRSIVFLKIPKMEVVDKLRLSRADGINPRWVLADIEQ